MLGPQWIRDSRWDRVLIWCWVPFAVGALVVDRSPAVLEGFARGIFLFSFSHQTLTLPLVYLDPQARRTRPWVYALAPVVFVGGVWFLAAEHFFVLAVVAIGWNAVHTLMQRFGVVRIYGRKAGQTEPGVERWLLFAWFGFVVATVAARGPEQLGLDRLGMSGANDDALEWLTAAQPAGVATTLVLLVVAIVISLRWAHAERAQLPPSAPKREYLVSTGALFATGLVFPVAGFLAFMGSHALEYYLIVGHTADKKYGPAAPASTLRSVVSSRFSTGLSLGAFGLAMAAAAQLLRAVDLLTLYVVFSLSIGGLHFFLDSFIWKLRTPVNAHSLDLPRSPARSGAVAAVSGDRVEVTSSPPA